MGSRRSETTCSLVGPFKDLDDRQLPSIKDVIKFVLFVKNDLKLKYYGKDPSNSDVFSIVYAEISNIWIKASIPIVSKERILQKM